MLKILSWNIQQGGGSRKVSIAKACTRLNAQVLVLSEFRNNDNGAYLRQQFLQAGYRYQVFTAAHTEDNRVGIFSQIPYVLSQLYSGVDPAYDANIATVTFEAFTVCGMYLPHKKHHRLFDVLQDLTLIDLPCIMVGDFNSGINYMDQVGNSFWYEDEFKKLLRSGMVDAWRHLNGAEYKDYSWYSHQGNGYRYDHTLVSSSLVPIIKSCHYLHQWREEKLSDHSPMLLELG